MADQLAASSFIDPPLPQEYPTGERLDPFIFYPPGSPSLSILPVAFLLLISSLSLFSVPAPPPSSVTLYIFSPFIFPAVAYVPTGALWD